VAILLNAFAVDGFTPHATAILTWLWVTFHGMQLNNRGPPATHLTLAAPFSGQDLSTHRAMLLHTALPGLLQKHQGSLDMAIVQMAHAIGAQATEARSARLAKEVAADQPTLPSEKFAMMLLTLLSYWICEMKLTFLIFGLPPKKQEFSIIREAFDAYSCTQGASLPLAPVPSPKLVTDLTSIRFVGDNPDDLSTGLQPCVIMDGSEDHHSAAQELARYYALLAEQDVSLSYRLKHLCHFLAPPHTPLYTVFTGRWLAITTSNLTQELRALGHTVGLTPNAISICSLRASGAMALLCANIHTDRIHLLGHWQSDEMLQCLRVQAYPVVAHLAPSMLQHGQFSFLPHTQP